MLRDEIARVARGYDHVLVFGESGTGKELVARCIHDLSERAAGKYTARNSSNFSPALVEAQLFGTVANYPTPGTPATPGLLPSAHGGTAFFDEVGDLSLQAQTQLLRFLDKGECQPVGETTARKFDVRLIGATNKPESELRADFRRRFKAVIRLVPLRERREDIPLLVRDLLLQRSKEDQSLLRFFEKGPSGALYPRIGGRLMDFLLRHPLYGNMRELDELLLLAVAGSEGNTVAMIEPDKVPAPQPQVSFDASPSSKGAESDRAKDPTKKDLVAALASVGGSATRAAMTLGIGRSKLYRLKREYGLDKGERGPDSDPEDSGRDDE